MQGLSSPTRVSEECAYTLTATDYKSPPIINNAGIDYIVRRLCPTECARLQGFPDWWCADLETDTPTLGEIERWREIFTEYGAAIGKNIKRKTDKQIIKWLNYAILYPPARSKRRGAPHRSPRAYIPPSRCKDSSATLLSACRFFS